jgi:very-short-patch-repair endonuclease
VRRIAKKDDNHNEITEALRRFGFSIFDTHQIGGGFPDFICARAGVTAIVEVKGKTGKLREDQKTFRNTWNGMYIVARHYTDVLKDFGIRFK